MAQKIQVRRGNTSARTGKVFDSGEPVWDTDQKALYIGDGITSGGIPASPTVSFKNKLINGAFDFWQRGTSFSAAGFTADRWRLGINGSSAALVRAGGTTSIDRALYQCQVTITSVANASNYVIFAQKIEGVRSLAGKTVTLSFNASSNTAGKKIGASFDQVFGTGGSPSTTVSTAGQSVTLTTSLARYSMTFVIPDTSGKTLGTNNDDGLTLNLFLDAGSSFDARSGTSGQQSAVVTLDQIQVEIGSISTDFELRPTAVELIMCQRYYEKSFDLGVTPADNTTLTNNISGTVYSGTSTIRTFTPFKVTKRSAPTMTMYRGTESASGTNGRWNYFNTSWIASTNTVTPTVTTTGFTADVTGTSLTVNSSILVAGHWTADAEL